ncbi:MAG: cation diffusion facilitator family transporter [Pseudomonadota bacterium]|nr:cation diffusion facilitator family transporter [Pseudomonadota bacterium]
MHRPDHNDHKHLHSHHHFDPAHTSEKALVYAVTANMSLTGVQVIGGLFAGSLAVIADAMHNFGDACILILALFALKIGQRPADSTRTFGYKRAENVAALVSLTALCMISLFLIVEALGRFFYPREVEGWIMVAVTVFALAVDLWTVWLTHKGAAFSSNIHAAFLHNLFDALASIGVLCGGILIILFQWYWIDTLITILVASYAIYLPSSQ